VLSCIIASVLRISYVGPLNGFWSSDQGVKLIQVQSMLLNRFSSSSIIYPGATLDPEGTVSPLRGQYFTHNGQTYAMFSDAFALLSSIPFFIFGFAGLYIVPILSLAALALLGVRIARPLLGAGGALLVALTISLTSPLLFYSVIFWEHLPATLLVTLGIWQTIQAHQRDNWRRAFGAGLAIGISVWLRNETALAAPALIGAVLIARHPRALRIGGWIGAGVTIGLLPLLIYNQLTFGAAVGPHVLVAGSVQYQNVGNPFSARIAWADLLIVPLDEPALNGAISALAIIAVITSFRRTPRLITGALGFSVALTLLTAILLQAVPRGGLQTTLLVTFPVVLLSLFPTAPDPSADRMYEPVILVVFGMAFILLAWLARLPDGGAQWGPRMLLPALPALTIAGAWRVFSWMHRPVAGAMVTGVAAILIFVALLTQFAGLRQLRAFNLANHTLLTTVAQSGARVIITDTWYGPPLLAPIFYDERIIFLIDDGADLDYLLGQLHSARFNTVYYLSGHGNTIAAEARRWHELVALGEPSELAHGLTGQAYRIGEAASAEPAR